jgi:hypothetical protein
MSITGPQFDPDPDYWEKRVMQVEDDLREIKDLLNTLRSMVEDTQSDIRLSKTVIDKVAAEVMPTVNSLMESPMLKMLMPKGKK